MKKNQIDTTNKSNKKIRPALTPEARENQMIALAIDVAEQQLLNGTASSQVITHFLKLGSELSRLECKKIEHENKLLEAKTKSIESSDKIEKLYKEAMAAMQEYKGQSDDREN